MPKKQSSPELSSLAAKVQRRRPIKAPFIDSTIYNALLEDAQKLAGSVLSQDEESAGG
jgi:hypothetical protein